MNDTLTPVSESELPDASSRLSESAVELMVVQRVLDQLGTPTNLYRVDAHRVWGDNFRVNVFCALQTGLAVPQILITDSFFVTLTQDGLVARPSISRRYRLHA